MPKIVKHKLEIDGMHCTSCALNIDWDLEEVKGVKSAKTSYNNCECEVEFDEEEIELDAVILTIKKTGYQARLKKSQN